MKKSREVTIVTLEARTLYGLSMPSGDKSAARDIAGLTRRYRAATGTALKGVPLYVLSRDYDQETRAFTLFVGGEEPAEPLTPLPLPAGQYAVLPVSCGAAPFWGMAVGRAKRFFYTEWLPASGFRARNLEYEHHTEKSVGRRPRVDLLFAIEG